MKVSQIAAQMYSVRESTKTPADLKKSLAKIRKIGYEAVQLSGHGPIKDAELKRILDGSGLVCCATHEASDSILDTPHKVAEKLHAIGCKATAYPYPKDIAMSNLREVKSFAGRLNKAGKVLHEAGIHFSYHNHDIEFVQVAGRPILDHLLELTDPTYLGVELDVFWVQAGGGNPVDWCKKLKGRMPLLHIKDYGVTPARKPVFEEIGQGNFDWPTIIKAAESAKCKWFIVEQDADFANGDAFKSLKMSFDFIKTNLVRQ